MRVSFSTKDIEVMLANCVDETGRESGGQAHVDVSQLRALLRQALIVSPMIDENDSEHDLVMFVRTQNLMVIERRFVQLAPEERLVRVSDLEQAIREVML